MRFSKQALCLFFGIMLSDGQEVSLEISRDDETGDQVLDMSGGGLAGVSHMLEFSEDAQRWFPLGQSRVLPWQYFDEETGYRKKGFYRVERNALESITGHSSWKNEVILPDDPFRSEPVATAFGQEEIRWIKFSILFDNVPSVYFQDGSEYQFHYNFANERLNPYLGVGFEEFNGVSLFPPDQEVVLGAVLFAPSRKEFAFEFVGQEVYPPEMLAFLYSMVDEAVARPDDWRGFYFPTFEQVDGAKAGAEIFERAGINLGSIARWQNGDACYAEGWALGRLVYVPGVDIEEAFLNGDLLSSDILITDGVPAEIPYVAGIISTTPSTPNSHVAILAQSYGVPFVYLSDEQMVELALEMLGEDVVLRGQGVFSGECVADVFLAQDVSPTYRSEILDLKSLPPLDLTVKANQGAIAMDVEIARPSDVQFIGGKAANFGLLRSTIPDCSPEAMAFTFDLWDAYLAQALPGGGTLEDTISARLSGHVWPPSIAVLDADLRAVRGLIKDTADFSTAQENAIVASLQGAGFDAMKKIRFRSSTNVEDSDHFVGAGLYDSYSGCLQDDLDGDDVGPSHCDPEKENERGVLRAMRKVYASFYNLNAYLERLRRGVNEDEVGMAILAHHSFPDELEAANGVITGRYQELGGTSYLFSEVVTQEGANSVTNPDGGSIPEVVEVNCYDGGCSAFFRERSSLLPLGEFSVMTWQDDYHALVQKGRSVAEAMAARSGESDFMVEFEFKKLSDGSLVIKQVRKVPEAEAAGSEFAALVNRPMAWEVFQGEAADLFSNHNLKLRLAVESTSRWLDAAGTAESFLTKSDWAHHNEGLRVDQVGPVSSWGNASFEVREIFGSDYAVDSWKETSFAGGSADFELRVQLPNTTTLAEQPVQTLGDFRAEVHADFSAPQLTVDHTGFSTTTSQVVILTPSVTDQVLPNGSLEQLRTGAFGDVSLEVKFFWPQGPTGISAGYTAPLQKWDTTTVTGLTSEPIVLRGYFSQTYRPGHHNFTEEFLFEPRLEEGMSQDVLTELEALDVKQIYVFFGGVTPEVKLIGFDDRVRDL